MVRTRNSARKAQDRAAVARAKSLEAQALAEAADRAAEAGKPYIGHIARASAAANIADTAAQLAGAWADVAEGADKVPARIAANAAHEDACDAWTAVREVKLALAPA